ncbi:non-ribosomal peptide synthetase [Streptomyces sp. NBC_01320]|uniref:non-ribosomal peptide synthetase n=1 Tax=Streptomyces sp. NBC_01320 TaxID=2903824 RepID=UPI002E11F3F8|nr:non-ribosomal peptide synthetase [Streptomyces sp. NBC_01320]WSJ94850.1 amino acid adenylation domain-containing protein [Streptomyces sp. NBC_01320]
MESQMWPRTSETDRSGTELLPARFELQAARTPDALAVLSGRDRLGYAELDRRSNRLAHALRDRGIGPEDLVAVCLPRGVGLVVALLAVWKAGAAYVPLDPGHPRARLEWVLGDTAARVVITDGPTARGALRDLPVAALCLDEERDRIAAQPATALPGPVSPAAAAYVIYTSGSTGRPKGVLVDHAGIANRVGWTVRRHGIGPDDRILQKTTMSFDAAGWEIFAPLTAGGTVVMAPEGAERDPALLLRAVAEQRITVLQVVPSVLRLLADEDGWAHCTELRLLFCAGEPLHADLCRRLPDRIRAGIWNTYGPTECSIDVTAHPVHPDREQGPVPIGRPIDSMRVLVLDTAGTPVPVGVPGELYAGGPGVARGYLGRPRATAASFVPDPYGAAGERLYRTGDRARWRSDGVLEYVGRVDHQVKINGTRVEPGEAEAALAAHPGLSGAVVTPFKAPDGTARLAAHVVPRAEPVPAAELRAFLRGSLTEALIPSVYVTVDAFPLNASGKVDRSALPDPSTVDDGPAAVGPRTDDERLVARVWAELLGTGTETVGAHDDFFRLGGTSLHMTRLLGRLTAATGRRIELRDLFTATTVAEQAQLLERGAPTDDAATVTAAGRDAPLPLSFAQERIWFLDRMNPASAEWVTPVLLRLPAGTTAEAVRTALRALADRHEILRTRYVTEHGEPRQLADARSAVDFQVLDAGPEGPAPHLTAQLAQGFDLEQGPVWRARLIRTPGEEALLVLTIHHIASDGWSSVLLENDLRALCLTPEAEHLPELPLQYVDFAVRQREQSGDEESARQLAHWREALDGLAPLDLPTAHPRPAERDISGSVVGFHVPHGVTKQALALGQHHGATPFMTLLTAFSALLSRYTGSEDIAVGTPVSGRTRPESAGVAGCFLNNLVIRCDLGGDPTFTAALERIRDTVLTAFAHQDLPFERLVDAFGDRDRSRTPLYQAAFDLLDEGQTGSALSDSDLALLGDSWRTAKTDLTLFVHLEPGGGARCQIEYATALFERGWVENLAAGFVRLLDALASAPSGRISQAPLLGAAEQALVAPAAVDDAGQARTMHEVFEEQAAATPGAVAVVAGDTELTYGELNARANRLAHRLRALGAGPEALVGVCLERGPELVPALLGVLKSGAAYVPLDPAHPLDRWEFILGDTAASLVVTTSEFAERLGRIHSGTLIVLDEDAPQERGEADAEPSNPAPLPAGPDSTAYVIYTSGSTGRPKGVCVSHTQVWRLHAIARRHYAFGADDVWPLFHSYAFDVSVWELWGALAHGGRLVVVPFDVARSPDDFLDLLVRHRVTVLNQTPSAFRSLVGAAGSGDPRIDQLALRAVVFAGERLEFAELAPWVERLGLDRPQLLNMYGITETTVHSTYHRIAEDDLTAGGNPVGRPLADLRIHLLDRHGQTVPVGVTGEIHVGGPGVARGYLGRPGLTAERFLPDPFGPPGARFYRSGDLARRNPDGTLDFLGRIDDQVKIRGYRIELGEIQAALADRPAVRDAAVVVREDRPGDRRLVAYVVMAPDASADGGELRAALADRLPPYMVPAAFVVLDALPLTANGKLDRRALPAPEQQSLHTGGDYVHPRSQAEEAVTDIWAQILHTERIGVHDNFFELGGNSLLALRLVAAVQEQFDIDLPVRKVFDMPSVAQLAAEVETQLRADIARLDDAALLTDPMLAEEREI